MCVNVRSYSYMAPRLSCFNNVKVTVLMYVIPYKINTKLFQASQKNSLYLEGDKFILNDATPCYSFMFYP